ncbi:MAG TPA: hypothetical protein VFD79_01995 [Tissierellaceae bacterium]|nr:hypothetical protein [Tissierellaceae bacterium]
MPDSVTQGQFKRFLKRNQFVSKGKKNNLYFGMLDGKPRAVVFHYHKDNDIIPTGTLSAIARSLELSKTELIDRIKAR